ncbi:MAG: hypothetical protein KatS3mg061_0615 [Dehalococcoidia bacterium]|nr:MAG: hypothetical protein KatS3mg061_0615 [Dehalococcoidia bacterium]
MLASLTAGVAALSLLYPRASSAVHALTVGFGYLSLLLIGLTLLIGPLRAWRGRRNPVNVPLRRDVGIWAGITALVHVASGSQIHFRGDLVRYFFALPPAEEPEALEPGAVALTLRTDLFGLANWVGLAATVLVLLLLMLSNDLSLRWLRGQRWKALQRLNYLFVVLVLVHTVAYQQVVAREPLFLVVTVALALVVAVTQVVGVYWTRRLMRRRQRPAAGV